MHINLLNSDRFYSSNKVYHKFQEIFCFNLTFYINCCLLHARCVDFTEIHDRLHFFCISRRGGKGFLEYSPRSLFNFAGQKPVFKVEKERSYLQPTVRDVIAMRKTSAMFRYLIYLAYRATSYQSNHQVFLL